MKREQEIMRIDDYRVWWIEIQFPRKKQNISFHIYILSTYEFEKTGNFT